MNNVLLFGSTGSAKSTICGMVCLYFHETSGYAPFINAADNTKGAKLIREWMKLLRRRKFPRKTPLETEQRIDIGYENMRRRERVGFSFLEVAGEQVVKLDPLHPEHSAVSATVRRWLEESDTVILVGSSTPRDDDRYILQSFMEVLSEADDIPRAVAFVLSEWDRAGNSASFLEYATANYGEVLKLLARLKVPTTVMPFSVGAVSGDGEDANIDTLDFTQGTEQLIRWLVDSMRLQRRTK